MPSRESHLRCCELAEAEIDRFVEVIRGAPPEVPVPTCGRWTLADLIQHTGHIHRWAAAMVAELSGERHGRRKADEPLPADPARYADWLGEARTLLIPVLRAADPDARMWAWGPDKRARFWSRRMVHETAVHRVDAELALGIEPAVDGVVAVDGVDEFLENPPARRMRGSGERIVLAATDRPDRWSLSLEPDRFVWSRSETDPGEPAAVTVRGVAADLDLLLWQRRHHSESRFTVSGDVAVLERWRAGTPM